MKVTGYMHLSYDLFFNNGGKRMQRDKISRLQDVSFVDINDIVVNADQFYAHIPRGITGTEERPELLKEHIDRCSYYFNELCREKKLEDIWENFIIKLEIPEQCHELFYTMLVNTIYFHDFGKINPEFQRIKMRNEIVADVSQYLDGSKHSMLSTAIYIDYYSNVIQMADLTKIDMEKMQVLLLANAYVISRHHADLTPFQEFLDEFHEDEKLETIFSGMHKGVFKGLYQGPFYSGRPSLCNMVKKNQICFKHFKENNNVEIALYAYIRLLYSLLISSDYYATSEYENHIKMKDYGSRCNMSEMNEVYEQSELVKTIRAFNPADYEDDGQDINILRKCMFYEAEDNLMRNSEKNIFFLEAPTGGGKSNIAVNCSLKLLKNTDGKIIYAYPFNTLVEQNYNSLEKIYGQTDLFHNVTVVNSITPIKSRVQKQVDVNQKEDEEDNSSFYQQALLDRQFLNYPFILTSHVTLFETMFGSDKSAAISFYQLTGSVIVLDEIQSYRNKIWTEIMMFLEQYSELLNIKVIIMSATLPQLSYLTGNEDQGIKLIRNHAKYFEDPRFKKRVKISYELLDSDRKTDEEILLEHILKNAKGDKKILVEFIKKKRAEDFYQKLKEYEGNDFKVLCMTGDDNQLDRKRILDIITINQKAEKQQKMKGIILVATQVVEAGVDIDMDIGYKDISKLDSEEQFMGRINRNFKRDGITYFFHLDDAQTIYGKEQDIRLNRQYTLCSERMRQVLEDKDFGTYYKAILQELQDNRNNKMNENGMEHFINMELGMLDFPAVSKRMKLIDDNQWDMSIYLARNLMDENGNDLDGECIWNSYKELLLDQTMEYAEKKVKLSEVRSKMTYFIYRIKKNSNLNFNDRIGELYYIKNGERYFVNDRLDRELLASDGAIFIDL